MGRSFFVSKGEPMPKALEDKLKKEAAKKGLKGKKKGAYVYGTLQKTTDWKPSANALALGAKPKKKGK